MLQQVAGVGGMGIIYSRLACVGGMGIRLACVNSATGINFNPV